MIWRCSSPSTFIRLADKPPASGRLSRPGSRLLTGFLPGAGWAPFSFHASDNVPAQSRPAAAVSGKRRRPTRSSTRPGLSQSRGIGIRSGDISAIRLVTIKSWLSYSCLSMDRFPCLVSVFSCTRNLICISCIVNHGRSQDFLPRHFAIPADTRMRGACCGPLPRVRQLIELELRLKKSSVLFVTRRSR